MKKISSRRSKHQTINFEYNMATITMSQEFTGAIQEMCQDAVSQAVNALAKKYGFDEEEAHSFLKTDELTLVNKRGASAKTTKTSKAKVDSEKKTRAKTGYNLYCAEMREEVREEILAMKDGEKMERGELMKALGAKWKGETQEVRDEWNEKAKELSESGESD